MPTATQTKQTSSQASPTLVGWHGITFQLPPEWNVTGFSLDRADGYLKIDSPGTMFAQVRWMDPRAARPRTVGDLLFRLWKRRRPSEQESTKPPDLRAILDNFLAQTRKQVR